MHTNTWLQTAHIGTYDLSTEIYTRQNFCHVVVPTAATHTHGNGFACQGIAFNHVNKAAISILAQSVLRQRQHTRFGFQDQACLSEHARAQLVLWIGDLYIN